MEREIRRIQLCTGDILAPLLIVLMLASTSVLAQNGEPSGRNNPYSPSPSIKGSLADTSAARSPLRSDLPEAALIIRPSEPGPAEIPQATIAQQTFKIARDARSKELLPTETYRVGVGDVLFVNLKNSPNGSGYYTVRENGTIDYPLAGDNVVVAAQTLWEVEETLRTGVTLFADPHFEVKIREYSSHKISVGGAVEHPGDKFLQREALPLFAIKAEAGIDPRATTAIIERAPLLPLEKYDLADEATDKVIIEPGNTIRFVVDPTVQSSRSSFYYIAGAVTSAGQRELTQGITLYQAVISAGGTKGDPKKAIVRRKAEDGTLVTTEFNLRSIKRGKSADPILKAGDVVEILD